MGLFLVNFQLCCKVDFRILEINNMFVVFILIIKIYFEYCDIWYNFINFCVIFNWNLYNYNNNIICNELYVCVILNRNVSMCRLFVLLIVFLNVLYFEL